MPSLATVWRAIVMFAAAVLLVKGWQSYGPSAEQLKKITLRALGAASDSTKQTEKPFEEDPGLVTEEKAAVSFAPPLVDAAQSALQTGASGQNMSPQRESSVNPPGGLQIFSGPDREHLSALLERLETLGGTEPKLTAWGTTGELYRFSCRAAIADSSTFARHFESVSTAPQAAVEDVVAKIEAWRTSQQEQ